MKKLFTLLVACTLVVSSMAEFVPVSGQAQQKLDAISQEINDFLEQNPAVQQFLDNLNTGVTKGPGGDVSLPAYMTPEEQEINRQIRSVKGITKGSRKPSGSFMAPAEYDPTEGIFLGWPNSSHSTLQGQIAKAISDKYKVFIITQNESMVRSALSSAGAKMDNIQLLSAPLEALWVRDYGPWWIHTQSGNREIIDLKYYYNRPNDDAVPKRIGAWFNFPVHDSGFETEGGNIILDGHGVAIVGDVLISGNDSTSGSGYSASQVKQYMRDYFGCNKTIILDSLDQAGGTGHIDIFAKLLDDRTIIVGQHSGPDGGYRGNYQRMEDAARILAQETNGKGEKFNVVRIPMPDERKSTFTYTNSLIINDKALVPTYTGMSSTSWNNGINDRALQVYRDCMPGTTVYGIDCTRIIYQGGCIHCITKDMIAEQMKITYKQPKSIRGGRSIPLNLEVRSNTPVNDASVCVFWSTIRNGNYQQVQLEGTDGNYTGSIPAQEVGTQVFYYFAAEDVEGAYKTLPDNAPDAELFSATIQ
ncbi:MAG: agmatine deiminase family protein [Candidatus Wallbacteria bacterium]|nr:agmatine deiminase family protein [Candidatus Wallbacteria bacterium]